MTREEARQRALSVIYWKRMFGADPARIRHTTEGFVAPGYPGYDLHAERITVPANTRPGPRHTFSVDDLINELEAGQGDLFGGEG